MQCFSSEQEFYDAVGSYLEKDYTQVGFPELCKHWFIEKKYTPQIEGELLCCVEILFCQRYTWQGRLTVKGDKLYFANQFELVELIRFACQQYSAGKRSLRGSSLYKKHSLTQQPQW
ncbi:hypothetical protein U6B65_06165 [Oscillospiraceae bacterium MB08-C2-2]|nr:hypothetical protein U6B65_06165 [Oscillospiraceae bacterium MB08-C2-2]